ncbi:MAG: cysteine--tRNA ligase [Burkholderiaceae bacterium]|jgi:cysteinyl-tRNA synthetase|nr:cysteine--tRNA ligase [Burkholderiaceae bacterium]
MNRLQIYNSLSREKELFVPIEPGKVRMYVCGMTVYDFCHIGHARMLLCFDMIYRWLKEIGYAVTYVRNITDIDDKIIQRAAENGETIQGVTTRFTHFMHEDLRALGILPPDLEPRATEFVPQMLEIIEKLEANGLAYQSPDGDVHYSVRDFAGYGRLSGRSLEDLRSGERVEVNAQKRDPLDFVLWKAAKSAEPAEAKWQSKWGVGRPGWHIECSAMSCQLLGQSFDIHGGGADLQFPHHENEIAQSEGAFGKKFVNYWIHNGFVRVDDEKMSKSLGNFFTIREVLTRYHAEVLRFFIIRSHYRSPLNYSDAHLEDARAGLTRLYTALNAVPAMRVPVDWQESHAMRFAAAMNDDFNTPVACAVLFELANEVNRTRMPQHASQLKALAGMLGLLQQEPRQFLQGGALGSGLTEPDILVQIAARHAAKKAKDFSEADRIRAVLLDAGIVLEDRPGGVTEWRRA